MGCSQLDPTIQSADWPDGTPTCDSEDNKKMTVWLLRGTSLFFAALGAGASEVAGFVLTSAQLFALRSRGGAGEGERSGVSGLRVGSRGS